MLEGIYFSLKLKYKQIIATQSALNSSASGSKAQLESNHLWCRGPGRPQRETQRSPRPAHAVLLHLDWHTGVAEKPLKKPDACVLSSELGALTHDRPLGWHRAVRPAPLGGRAGGRVFSGCTGVFGAGCSSPKV